MYLSYAQHSNYLFKTPISNRPYFTNDSRWIDSNFGIYYDLKACLSFTITMYIVQVHSDSTIYISHCLHNYLYINIVWPVIMATTNLMLESSETVTGAKCRLLLISENLSRFPSEDMKLSQLKNYKFWGEASILYEFPYYNIAMLQV